MFNSNYYKSFKDILELFLKNNKILLILGLVFSSSSIILQMVINYIIDNHIISEIKFQEIFEIKTVLFAFWMFMFVFLFEIIVFVLSQIIINFLIEKTSTSINLQVIQKFDQMSLLELNSENKGELLEKINLSIESYKQLLEQLSGNVIKNIINILFLTFFFGSLGTKYILIILYAFIFNYFKKTYFQPRIDKVITTQDQDKYKMSGKFFEITTNLETLKHYNVFTEFKINYSQFRQTYLKQFYKAETIQFVYKAITYFNNAIILFGVLWFLFLDYGDNKIKFGIFLFGYTSSIVIVFASNNIFNVLNSFEKSRIRIKPLIDFLRTENELVKTEISINKNIRSIEINELNFNYDNNQVFNNFNYKFESNNSYAIIGESGVGKSTLIKLIGGQLSIPDESLVLNTQNNTYKFNTIDYDDYSKLVTVVPQVTQIFNLSVKDNITLFRNHDNELFENVINISQLAPVIANLPNGINTIIGDGGHSLSGGEKQRISIARALLLSSPIIIFDESTSSLDIENEKKIIDEIIKLKKGKIIIFVTHRIDSMKNVDNILKLEKI